MPRNETQFKLVFHNLQEHFRRDNVLDIRAHFARAHTRFSKFSRRFDDLLFDFSKVALTEKTLTLLFDLAEAAALSEYRDKMFEGKPINVTEQRAVLHTALRLPEGEKVCLNGRDIVKDVHYVLSQMAKFSEGVRCGNLKGATGKAFTDIVNIGIGGSDLGPQMCVLALKPYHDGPKCHFVSNIDSADIADCLANLNPETTLFILSSKSFTTTETIVNGRIARQWIVDTLGERAVSQHFVAVSSAVDKANDFGIESEKVFHFWNWVGGRYSIWSAIGLSLMLAIGSEKFGQFLAGAHAMDEHFRETPYTENLPILLGLIGYWQRVFCGYNSRVIVPYEQRLSHFPAYLQQLDMESNGKSVSLEGVPVTSPTGPIVWGATGTNSQHAFFQLLHQGTDIIPVEFIAFIHGHEPNLARKHSILLAHCLAQGAALLKGRPAEEVAKKLSASGEDKLYAEKLAIHRSFAGNRPSLLLLQEKLTPFALGRLIALYEHRVFVEGVLMNINSFDQWGVELGKELAQKLCDALQGKTLDDSYDSSTRSLIEFIQNYTEAKS